MFSSSISLAKGDMKLRLYKGLYCYDGDTCYIYLKEEKLKIRLLELDTPEISKPKCAKEKKWGIRSRDFVNSLIKNAKKIEFITDYEFDYFGRILSYLIIDGEDLSSLLVKNNLGVVYKKGLKKDWCS